jgi:hypothetical protein
MCTVPIIRHQTALPECGLNHSGYDPFRNDPRTTADNTIFIHLFILRRINIGMEVIQISPRHSRNSNRRIHILSVHKILKFNWALIAV